MKKIKIIFGIFIVIFLFYELDRSFDLTDKIKEFAIEKTNESIENSINEMLDQ